MEGGKNIQCGKDKLVNKWCWENWAATFERMKLEHSLTPYTEANSKWIKDLTVKLDTTNIKLEESRLDPLTEITARPFGVYLLVRDR